MTKVFTSLVLMDMAEKGEAALTDPVLKYLPANVTVPERNGRKITLRDISTQSSGLPNLPSNIAPKDMANPYAELLCGTAVSVSFGLSVAARYRGAV